MSQVIVSGGSDDIVCLDGAIRAEFNPKDADEGIKLAFSEGTVLAVHYDKDGCWRVNRLATGTASYAKVEAEGPDTDNYSDKVTLTGAIAWVVGGAEFEKAK